MGTARYVRTLTVRKPRRACAYMRITETRCCEYGEMAGSWSREETLKLIEIWGNDAIQAQLESCKRNQEIFGKIAAETVEEESTIPWLLTERLTERSKKN